MEWLIYTVLVTFVPANHYPLRQYINCRLSSHFHVQLKEYCQYQFNQDAKPMCYINNEE